MEKWGRRGRSVDAKDVIVVVAAVLSAAVTISVPIVNHLLTRRKYASEKLWDLRRDIYSRVIFNISEAERHYTDWNLRSKGSSSDSGRKAMDAFQRALDDLREGYVVCSPAFRAVVETAERQFFLLLFLGDEEDKKIEKDLHEARDKLLTIARRELML
jgi:hypothetical protein